MAANEAIIAAHEATVFFLEIGWDVELAGLDGRMGFQEFAVASKKMGFQGDPKVARRGAG